MTSYSGVVVGVLGRYASEAELPFSPRIETVGVVLSQAIHDGAVEALRAAWESTLPWASSDILQEKAEAGLRQVLRTGGIRDVDVQVVVVDNIPFHVRQ